MTKIDTKGMLNRLLAGTSLPPAETTELFGAMMDGLVPEVVMSGLLVALRAKGESGTEVAAAAAAMRKRVRKVPVAALDDAIDTCGTGGDGADTVNISTAAALVAAAAGVPVAKHGNRSVSSRCGSADVLEALGVVLELDAPQLGRLCDEAGISFLFAPRLHPAMKAVMPVRRSLGVRTVFNLLGPLTNPAGVRRQVVGVWGRDVQDLVAEALAELGAEHAYVVHSEDGLDELSVLAPTRVLEVIDGRLVGETMVDPAELGVRGRSPESLRGGDVTYNAQRMEMVLSGGEDSAASEAVALNAGAALVVAGQTSDLKEGFERAREIVASGEALAKLQSFASLSQGIARHG
jgi:anthranilate phosphoribosyltransferase